MRKVFNLFWILLFLIGSVTPLLHMDTAKISKQENRTLAKFPEVNQKGKINPNYGKEFESWLGDRFWGRKFFLDGRMYLYRIYVKQFPRNVNKILGENNEEYYMTSEILKDFVHLNLFNEEKLKKLGISLQKIKDYAGEDKMFFYYQCWDKKSIYPEFLSSFFTQKEKISRTDQMIEAIKRYSNVFVISPKLELIEGKRFYRMYPKNGDIYHWSQRGAYIGYLKLMNAINEKSKIEFNVLKEEDFSVFLEDQGKKIFLKKKNAYNTPQKLKEYPKDARHVFYTNDTVDNKTRVLIIGDSYFTSVTQMLAESFYETILIWGDYLRDVKNVLDSYEADIIIIEAAERVDRSERIITGGEKLKNPVSN